MYIYVASHAMPAIIAFGMPMHNKTDTEHSCRILLKAKKYLCCYRWLVVEYSFWQVWPHELKLDLLSPFRILLEEFLQAVLHSTIASWLQTTHLREAPSMCVFVPDLTVSSLLLLKIVHGCIVSQNSKAIIHSFAAPVKYSYIFTISIELGTLNFDTAALKSKSQDLHWGRMSGVIYV